MRHASKTENQMNKGLSLSWAEQPQTIDEVGSIYTIHGFDLNYAGVILGTSIKFRDNHIIFDPSSSCNKRATHKRTLDDVSKKSFGKDFLRNELGVLLTRGVNGLYIYACDEELRKQLKKCVWLQFFNKSDILNMSWEINFVIWIKFYMKSIEVIGNATL